MARLGMDVDTVEAVGRKLQRQGDYLANVAGTVDALVGQADLGWDGNVGRRFVDEWRSHHRAVLLNAGHAVRGLGTSALNNAAEQRRVSGQSVSAHPFAGIDIASNSEPHFTLEQAAWSHGISGQWDGVQGQATLSIMDFNAHLDQGSGWTSKGYDAFLAAGVGVYLLKASGSVRAGNLDLQGSARVGAEGDASATAHIGPDGLTAKYGGKAFVGAEARAQATAHMPAGVDVTGGVEGSVGFGVHASGSSELSWHHAGFTVDAGAALFVGGGAKVEVDVDPVRALNSIGSITGDSHFGDDVQRNSTVLLNGAADGLKDFLTHW